MGIKKNKRQDKGMIDKVSATIILQTYLESKKSFVTKPITIRFLAMQEDILKCENCNTSLEAEFVYCPKKKERFLTRNLTGGCCHIL